MIPNSPNWVQLSLPVIYPKNFTRSETWKQSFSQ